MWLTTLAKRLVGGRLVPALAVALILALASVSPGVDAALSKLCGSYSNSPALPPTLPEQQPKVS